MKPKKGRPYEYEASIPGDWAAFFMFLCVNAKKAWERGLAGASIAEGLCNVFRLPYSKAQVVESVCEVRFHRATILVDYREINELTKFFMWCENEVDVSIFSFVNDDGDVDCLNRDRVEKLGKCLWAWREHFDDHEVPVPENCGRILVTEK